MPPKRNPPASAGVRNNDDDGATAAQRMPAAHFPEQEDDQFDDQRLYTPDEMIAQATQVKVLSQFETVLWLLYAEECNEKKRPIVASTLVMLMKELGFAVEEGKE